MNKSKVHMPRELKKCQIMIHSVTAASVAVGVI